MNKNKLYLRDVNENDCDLLFTWANDDEVRNNSFNTEKISYDEHRAWFKNALQDEKCRQFILVYNPDNEQSIDVGQIRLNIKDDNSAEIDYSIASDYRTMGFGKVLINLICRKVNDSYPQIHLLIASVKPGNIASKKVFLDNGFSEKCSVYEYDLNNYTHDNPDYDADKLKRLENRVKIALSDEQGGVLFLTNNDNALSLYEWLLNKEHNVVLYSGKLTLSQVKNSKPDIIISYNYNHIIKRDVIDYMPEKIINLHISLLPWNRGNDPNFWSFVDDTPKGVTIHRIAEKLDAGEILLQQTASFDEKEETLKTSYDKLQFYIQRLFMENWAQIKENNIAGYFINEQGSYHRSGELEQIRNSIIKDFSWDMKICDIKKKYAAVNH